MMDTVKELLLDAAIVFFVFVTTAGAQCQPRSCHDDSRPAAAARAP